MQLLFYNLWVMLASLTDSTIPLTKRLLTSFYFTIATTPFLLGLESIFSWFQLNMTFVTFVIILIIVNAGLGAATHFKKFKDFRWDEFIVKTTVMASVVVLPYLVIEFMLIIAGENTGVDIFRTALQIATMLYPGSKILKNVHIWSEGKHPPRWIMQKVYNFEKDGNLNNLMSTDTNAKSK